MMMESLRVIQQGLPYMLQGAVVNVIVVLSAMSFGFILGLPLAVGQVYGGRLLRRVIGIYVWFFRGIPLLVLLFLFYFGLFPWLGINMSAFMVATLVLGLISAAYQSQIMRGSIASLSAGQMKAARALGMRDAKAIIYIILPQALRLSIPGWTNEYAILLKDSAVTYALGVTELMSRSHHIASRTYQHLAIYLAAGFIFLIFTWIGTKLLNTLHRKMTIPGYSR